MNYYLRNNPKESYTKFVWDVIFFIKKFITSTSYYTNIKLNMSSRKDNA